MRSVDKKSKIIILSGSDNKLKQWQSLGKLLKKGEEEELSRQKTARRFLLACLLVLLAVLPVILLKAGKDHRELHSYRNLPVTPVSAGQPSPSPSSAVPAPGVASVPAGFATGVPSCNGVPSLVNKPGIRSGAQALHRRSAGERKIPPLPSPEASPENGAMIE